MRRILLSPLVLAAACGITGPDRDVLTLEVAAQRVPCVGVAPQECLLVRELGRAEWQFLHDAIRGFEFAPGYRYVLRVERREVENPVADQSSLAYRLLRVVKREAAG